MKLRRYAVTVMDNWTPTHFFWTRSAAFRWRYKIDRYARVFHWNRDRKEWIEMVTTRTR